MSWDDFERLLCWAILLGAPQDAPGWKECLNWYCNVWPDCLP